MQFEQLAAAFGLGVRAVPRVMEAMMIDDATQRYALLIESPEPLDWDRITLDVATSLVASSPSAAEGAVKITNVFHETISGVEIEVIELIVRASANLAGASLSYVDATGEAFTWYVFGADTEFVEGSLLRVYATASVVTPVDTADVQYVASGQTSFLPGYVSIVLEDSDGLDLHVWVAQLAGTYAALPVRLVRSADKASVFVLPATLGSAAFLAAHVLRLHWVFGRDIGAGAVVLKRGGGTDAEEGYWWVG